MDAGAGNVQMGGESLPLGRADSRLVRELDDSSTQEVHVAVSGRTSDGDRCSDQPVAGEGDIVCIPTYDNYGQGFGKDPVGEAAETAPVSAFLANNNMVLESEKHVTFMDTDPTVGVEVTSTPHGLRSPKSGLHLLSSVVNSVPRLSALGYSEEVINQLNFARRDSTNNTYNSKWKLFVQFARDRKFDPFLASPALVAQFLLFVAKTRHATLSTIAGYRAALGRVLKLTAGYDPGNCDIISQLMQSFKRTQPVNAARIPCWSISFVLHVLSQPEFENSLLSDKVLTAKAIFLVALASGDRRSAIAALSYNAMKLSEDKVCIGYDKEFVPKSYFVKKNITRIQPLSIPKIPGLDANPVCPVRTLVDYVGLSNQFRSDTQSSLFISHVQNRHTNITPQSVSFYITFLVKWCYEKSNVKFPGCRAHDVRKIAASLRALSVGSLHDVLEAGNWAQPMTFVKHYFLEFSNEESSNLSHFPNIVTGRMINPCFFGSRPSKQGKGRGNGNKGGSDSKVQKPGSEANTVRHHGPRNQKS